MICSTLVLPWLAAMMTYTRVPFGMKLVPITFPGTASCFSLCVIFTNTLFVNPLLLLTVPRYIEAVLWLLLSNRALRVLFNTLLDTYAERVEDVIPDVLPQRHGPIPLQTALREASLPRSRYQCRGARCRPHTARRRLIFDECLLMEWALAGPSSGGQRGSEEPCLRRHDAAPTRPYLMASVLGGIVRARRRGALIAHYDGGLRRGPPRARRARSAGRHRCDRC